MARKKHQSKIVHFIVTIALMSSGIYYFWLNYVPQKWYETQMMAPNQNEAYYVNQWCTSDFGRKEAVLWDMTRVDCLTKDYAIEFDFAKKWAESIGQALYYGYQLNKIPGIVIISEDGEKDEKYINRIKSIATSHHIDFWIITPDEMNVSYKAIGHAK